MLFFYIGYFILLYTYGTSVESLIQDNVVSHSLLKSGEGYLYPYPKICSDILNKFAEHASNFTLCAIEHARPIRLCEKCIENYVQFHKKYHEILNTNVNGTTCKSIFISCDRLEVVQSYHDNVLAIWNKGHCTECFDFSSDKPQLSNQTKRFNAMYNETMKCIINNMNESGNSETVCEKCRQSYIQLDNYYKTLSVDGIGVDNVCMDIVDSMNATRSIWSKTLECCKLRRTPEIIFLCCSAIISFLPILFYVAMRYCSPIRDLPNLFKESRFKQKFLRSFNGGIN